MRKIIILLLSISTLNLKSQDIVFESDFDKSDIQDAFTLLGVSNFKYKMPVEFKGYYFDLTVKEYYDGKEVNVVSHTKKLESMRKVLQWKSETEEYTLKLQSIKFNDSIETYNVKMPRISLRGKQLKLRYPRNEYGWETLIDEKTKLSAEIEMPILTYATEPSNEERPNVAVYCELAEDRNVYKEWYSKYKIKHYFVFLITVSKK